MKRVILILLFSSILINAGEIKIRKGNKFNTVVTINFRGAEYISCFQIAKNLGANYYFNKVKEKAELKFLDYKLKFTANNPFVILTKKLGNEHQVFQMPVTAKYFKSDIYIPVNYSAKFFSLALGSIITFDGNKNELLISDDNLNTEKVIKWNKNIKDLSSIKYDIFQARIENKSNGTLLRFATKNKITEPRSSINNNKLYLFFYNCSIDREVINTIKPKGFIKSISLKYVKGNPQLELNLKPGYDKHEVFYDEEVGELLVSIHNKFLRNEKKVLEDINKWNFNTVVIDPGHGGKDPGAIGLNGVKEKNINLGIAKELGKIINKELKGVKVVYTRKDDRFVELYKRGKIANENKGNIFISIHCNSTYRKPSKSNGFEVYLLRPGKTKDAIAIAEKENSVISLEDNPSRYKKLTDENFILVSMRQHANMRFAETFADMLTNEWIKNVKITSRGIKQAGFYVLVDAAMPSVLIESGFLTNKKDVNYLKSKKGQTQIARAIFNALKKYQNFYKNSLKSEINH